MEAITEEKIQEDRVSEEKVQEESAAANLTKAEAKRLESEKRVKRIHELMVLIEKLNEDIDAYHSELWELLRQQVVLLPLRQRRERKPKEIAGAAGSGSGEEGDDGHVEAATGGMGHVEAANGEKRVRSRHPPPQPIPPERAAMLEKFFRSKPDEATAASTAKKDEFAQFGLSYANIPGNVPGNSTIESTKKAEGGTGAGAGGKRRARARAVSFDETQKKAKIENFEICDIFELKGVEPEFVRECLEKCDVTGDVRLFRQIFIKNVPKEQQILRFVGSKNYQCRRNGLWIDDHNGNYVRHVIRKIFENSYMMVNDLEHYDGRVDQFFTNSEHILAISSEDKYMDNLMNHINQLVDIKNLTKMW
jgi:hypothetical protein